MGLRNPTARMPRLTALTLVLLSATFGRAADVFVEAGHSMKYLANTSDPGIDFGWTEAQYDDATWEDGRYGVGYGAGNLIQSEVSTGTFSVYTRAVFAVADISSVETLFLGVDYDDGYVAWVNGVEVSRADEIPDGELAWDTEPDSHESSNGADPNYRPLEDISAVGMSALHDGDNVLAIGIWNRGPSSSDLVLVPRLSANESNVSSRGPYLQLGTPTSMVVRWRTLLPSDSIVRYGNDPDSLTSVVVGGGSQTTEHVVELAGLAPDSVYYYSVGTATEIMAGGNSDHLFRTSPEVGTPKPTRIWVLGDSGTHNDNARAVRDAYLAVTGERDTDLWLMLGDNAYQHGTDRQYQAAVFDTYPDMLRKSVLWPTLGNHDGHSADSDSQSGPYYEIFSLPTAGESGGLASGTEAYYSFDYGNVHFVCLDSYETDRSPNGTMLVWLREDLAETDQKWLIAFWHHPPYTKGTHDSDTESKLIDMRENALPILEDAGVDLVLTGHSHNYERSVLLNGHYGLSESLTDDMKINAGDGRVDGNGAYEKLGCDRIAVGSVYVVAGCSGKTGDGPLDHPAMFYAKKTLGSVVLEVDGNRLDATFIDDAGVRQDYLTLSKTPDECERRFRRGDTNADRSVDMSDAIFGLAFLFSGGEPPVCGQSLDANDDGERSISDIIYILGFLFVGQAAPPTPFPGCGFDRTPDSLPCTTQPACQ